MRETAAPRNPSAACVCTESRPLHFLAARCSCYLGAMQLCRHSLRHPPQRGWGSALPPVLTSAAVLRYTHKKNPNPNHI